MELRKFAACTTCVVMVAAAAGCADGTGQALTPTLPSTQSAANADGSLLKASVPTVSAPRSSVRVTTLTPQLSVLNATPDIPNSGATLSYQFEIYEGPTLVMESSKVSPSTDALTLWTVPSNTLERNKLYSWRVRAFFGETGGTWSDMASFRTPLPPPPPNLEGPVPCGSASGPVIIGCVANKYPEKLVKTNAGSGSLQRRQANMEFLRDRIIETGICKGLDLGRNFKRGTPVISHDFIVLRRGGQKDAGVDIASGYDDVDRVLKLTWQVFGPDRDYGFPYYSKYPNVDCTGVNDAQ